MRIVYVLTSLGIGGAERQAIALAERMTQRGHQVAVMVLLPRLPEEWSTEVDVTYLDMRKSPLGVMSGLLRAQRFLRAFQPDLVHSHTNHANMTARLLRLTGEAPVVLTTLHSQRDGGLGRMLAYRLTDGLSVHTTAVSMAVAERYIRSRAVPPHKCSVLTNAINADEFAPDSDRRARMRSELSAEDGFIWLAAGRITLAKDYANLLRAFTRVAEECSQVCLWIAGEGEDVARRELERNAGTWRIADRIRWLGLRRDMPGILDAADAFVLSSAWEGMPLVVGEAMAMEKSVVATRVGGVPEILGDTGMLAAPGDSAALANAMVAVMRQSPEVRSAQGRLARQRVVNRFSFSAKMNEWEALYASCLRTR